MSENTCLRPQTGLLLALVLAAWCFASNSIHADPSPDRSFRTCRELYEGRARLEVADSALECFNRLRADARATDPAAFRDASEYALQTAEWLATSSASPVARAQYSEMSRRIAAEAGFLPFTGTAVE